MPRHQLDEQDLRQSEILWYLHEYCGWEPSQQNSGSVLSWTGRCRWHSERSGSLSIYPDHLHCYSAGCGIHSDLAQLIGVEEFGFSFDDTISWEVFARRDALRKEFEKQGGIPLDTPEKEYVSHHQGGTRTQKALSVPGPLQRAILNRLTRWWHQQLLANNEGAREARDYLLSRGVFENVLKQCLVVGYMPDPNAHYLNWRDWTQFDALYRVSEQDLEKERQWYRARLYWETLTDEHLAFLRTPRAFAIRLGIINQQGYYRLANRLIFSCKNASAETRFYQSRVLPCSRKGIKFLNPPGIKKYPFTVTLAMVGRHMTAHVPGTLLTESPFGPLVAASWSLCDYHSATLGEGYPSLDQLAGVPTPIWLGQDNDGAQMQERGKGKMIQRRIVYPGEEQAKLYAQFFAEQQMEAHRLRPWKYVKGMDEWLKSEGAMPVVETMRQIQDAQKRVA